MDRGDTSFYPLTLAWCFQSHTMTHKGCCCSSHHFGAWYIEDMNRGRRDGCYYWPTIFFLTSTSLLYYIWWWIITLLIDFGPNHVNSLVTGLKWPCGFWAEALEAWQISTGLLGIPIPALGTDVFLQPGIETALNLIQSLEFTLQPSSNQPNYWSRSMK